MIRRNKWLILRLVVLINAIISGLSFQRHLEVAPSNIEFLGYIPILLLFLPSLMLFLALGFQFLNPLTDSKWERPTWNSNPFDLRQPLRAAHVISLFFVSFGIVTMLLSLLMYNYPMSGVIEIFSVGVGFWLGYQISAFIFCMISRWRNSKDD